MINNKGMGTVMAAFAVTTSAKEENAVLAATARQWAEERGVRYVPREKGRHCSLPRKRAPGSTRRKGRCSIIPAWERYGGSGWS